MGKLEKSRIDAEDPALKECAHGFLGGG